jgi:hypothetical protein
MLQNKELPLRYIKLLLFIIIYYLKENRESRTSLYNKGTRRDSAVRISGPLTQT